MPPVSASGTPVKTSSASLDRAEGREEQDEDQEQRERARRSEAAAARRAAARTGRPTRSSSPAAIVTAARMRRSRLGDERPEVAAAHVGGDDDAALAVLAADLIRSGRDLDLAPPTLSGMKPGDAGGTMHRWRRRRDVLLGGQRNRQALASPRGLAAQPLRQAHDEVEAPVAFEDLRRPPCRRWRPRRRPARRRRSRP